MLKPYVMKVNHLSNPQSLTPGPVSFSWIPEGQGRQSAFDLTVWRAEDEIFASGKIAAGSMCSGPGRILKRRALRITGGP